MAPKQPLTLAAVQLILLTYLECLRPPPKIYSTPICYIHNGQGNNKTCVFFLCHIFIIVALSIYIITNLISCCHLFSAVLIVY